MLSQQDNELLCRTGADTAMGKFFRRFWLPALLPDELPEPDCPPIRFRVLGEDLVAFRDTNGKVGFFTNSCPHRGASMFFGRNEEAGLRCVYHGWKFDTAGTCVDMPSEPVESNFRSKVHITAYPSAEFGGLIWIYMGPKEKQPGLPQYDWCLRDYPNLRVYKWMQESNYTQSVEGNLDTVHVNFLHRNFTASRAYGFDPDKSPVLQLQESDFGFAYGGRRVAGDGRYYWRVTPFVLPTFTSIPAANWDGNANIVIPMDDENCWWFTVSTQGRRSAAGAPEREHVVLTPGTWRQERNADNDYGIDREMQRTKNYTGLAGNRIEDAMVTESMGAIMDCPREHLGTTDQAMIFMRRQLIRAARQLEAGIEPPILNDPALFRVRPIDTVTDTPDLGPIWAENRAAHLAQVPLAVPVSAY